MKFSRALFSSSSDTYWRLVKKHTVPMDQKYKYFLVLDFEATCDRDVIVNPQEIIEFPVLKVNSASFQTEAVFHHYVKPKFNPVLSPFCINLTGILQDMVENEPHFNIIFKDFLKWLEQESIDEECIFVTCGDWDLKFMLPHQCEHLDIHVPNIMKRWINIKKAFSLAKKYYPKNIIDMLRYLNLPHVGKLHSGIDDCRNIANILKTLGEQGYKFEETGSLV